MATNENMESELKELKAKLQENKVIIGTEKVLKHLTGKKLSKVYLAKKCPQEIKEDIRYYAEMAKVPVIELGMDNEELGLFCKKGFFISVLGIKAEE